MVPPTLAPEFFFQAESSCAKGMEENFDSNSGRGGGGSLSGGGSGVQGGGGGSSYGCQPF